MDSAAGDAHDGVDGAAVVHRHRQLLTQLAKLLPTDVTTRSVAGNGTPPADIVPRTGGSAYFLDFFFLAPGVSESPSRSSIEPLDDVDEAAGVAAGVDDAGVATVGGVAPPAAAC